MFAARAILKNGLHRNSFATHVLREIEGLFPFVLQLTVPEEWIEEGVEGEMGHPVLIARWIPPSNIKLLPPNAEILKEEYGTTNLRRILESDKEALEMAKAYKQMQKGKIN